MKMNLWVRSQDGMKLVPINSELYIPNSRTGEDFGIFYKDKMLGYYKTKKRALEVLDEIQNILSPKYILDSSSITTDNSWVENGIIMQLYNTNAEIKELSTYVYQMPEN